MIPTFPEFKKIEVNDRKAVESYTCQYPPYSDFNFTSLWAWDTSDERMVSELNGNLVARLTDYTTSEQFLSFLGSNKIEETIISLLGYAEKHELLKSLELIPEVSIPDSNNKEFLVMEDRNNFDYILDIPSLSRLEGGSFKDLRRNVRKFSELYSQYHVEVKDKNESGLKDHILNLLDLWGADKIAKGKEFEVHKERIALSRLLNSLKNDHKFIITTISNESNTIAFSIEEILTDDYCIGHFWKADTQKTGIYDFLLYSIAKYLNSRGLTLWNFEQDLGIENLRKSKMKYRPVSFLKKFTVSSIVVSSVIE